MFSLNLGLGSLRMFRIFILLSRYSKSIQEMILVVRLSVPQAAAILILLIMLFFIFGVIGTTLINTVRWGNAVRESRWACLSLSLLTVSRPPSPPRL
jgi:hypothetical protein